MRVPPEPEMEGADPSLRTGPGKLVAADDQLRQDWVPLPGAVYSISSALALTEYPSAV